MIEFNHADFKKKRIIKTFIDATTQIISEEGIDKVTIRKIAKIAKYNSATIYNYFDNYNQLIFFAATKFLSEYTQALSDHLKNITSSMETFLLDWEYFSKYSFQNPQIYYAIFTENIGDSSENLMKKYYNLFPEELENIPSNLIPMLTETNFPKRCSLLIKPCIEDGFFSQTTAEEIDESIRFMYQGMLTLSINHRLQYDVDEATEVFIKHVKRIVDNAIIK